MHPKYNKTQHANDHNPSQDALGLSPIGAVVVNESGDKILSGQGYAYRPPYLRVQYEYNDREELSRRELDWLARKAS